MKGGLSYASMPRPVRHRFTLYALANLVFILLVGLGSMLGGYSNPRILHLILLFALCSSVIVDLDGLNGRYALLALFLLVYFVSFGVVDLTNIWTGSAASGLKAADDDSYLLSAAELLIFVGGIMWVLGYKLAVFMVGANPRAQNAREWPKSAILVCGMLLWVIGTIALYRWNVYILKDTTNEAVQRGLASISPLAVSAYILAQMCQPLGILLLVYSSIVHRDKPLVVIVVVMAVLQIFIGFVIDIKGVAMQGLILIIVSRVFLDGRIPKTWLAIGAIFVMLVYPYFTAYRTAIHGGGVARTTVVENFGEILEKTIAAKDRVNSGRERAGTFLERSSVKSSVEIIVQRTGNGVEFQHGYTLTPILATFIPRIVWSEKQGVPTGQLFNKRFNLTDSDDISISPSILGELYWNFGWVGALIGMSIIGLICGWVGARFTLSDARTVTRILVTVITTKMLIVGFEGAIDDTYVTWLRLMAGIGLLHLIFARTPAQPHAPSHAQPTEPLVKAQSERLFPNLLA